MTFYELMDIATAVANRIDVQWGFFITIHMALLGGIFFIDKPIPLIGKLGGTLVYAIFATANFRALRLQHRILGQAYDDIVALQASACCQNSSLMKFYVAEVAEHFETRMLVVASVVHLAALLVFVLSVFSIRSRFLSLSAAN